ncbi:MAG TPA: AraC family transcriptional regulator [Acidobacteriota bacterium]|nr:AraC family transcriptional regulator [Acidobacteriota bacterium]
MRIPYSPITAGIELKTVDAGTIRLTETIHPPGLQLLPHKHERPSIALVINGSFIEQFGRNAHHCNAGAVVIKPAETIHADQYGKSGARSLIIELYPNFLPLIPTSSPVMCDTSVIPMSALSLRIYNEFSCMDSCSILSIESLILELLAQTIRNSPINPEASKIPAWLQRARDLIHCEFKTSPDLRRIAEVAGVHPSHLARTFRKKYGFTIGEYLRKLKLEEATKELTESNKSISQISQDAGFWDQSHFVKCFKKEMGITPSEYLRGKKNYPH